MCRWKIFSRLVLAVSNNAKLSTHKIIITDEESLEMSEDDNKERIIGIFSIVVAGCYHKMRHKNSLHVWNCG